jgi:hypothetical protein
VEDAQNGRGEDVPIAQKSCRKRLKSRRISAAFFAIGVQTKVFLPIAFRNIFMEKAPGFSGVFRVFSILQHPFR